MKILIKELDWYAKQENFGFLPLKMREKIADLFGIPVEWGTLYPIGCLDVEAKAALCAIAFKSAKPHFWRWVYYPGSKRESWDYGRFLDSLKSVNRFSEAANLRKAFAAGKENGIFHGKPLWKIFRNPADVCPNLRAAVDVARIAAICIDFPRN